MSIINNGGLAQLARASALHAEGHRFDSDILHFYGFMLPYFILFISSMVERSVYLAVIGSIPV